MGCNKKMAAPELNFIKEGQLTLQEVNYAINEGHLSTVLPCNERTVYLNITTKEEEQFCVRLNMTGFQVVSKMYDTIDEEKKESESQSEEVYETIFALMEHISPSYRQQFSSQLADKLLKLDTAKKD